MQNVAHRDTAEALVFEFEDNIDDYCRDDKVIPLSAFTFDGREMVLSDDVDVASMPVWRD